MSAADTGHLVLSTLHTTNAGQSVGRILDFFKADEREQVRRQLAGTLQAVICQRMVPNRHRRHDSRPGNHDQHRHRSKNDRGKPPGQTAPPPLKPAGRRHAEFQPGPVQLVKAGKVSEKEALAKATNPQALEMNFKGIFLNEGGASWARIKKSLWDLEGCCG